MANILSTIKGWVFEPEVATAAPESLETKGFDAYNQSYNTRANPDGSLGFNYATLNDREVPTLADNQAQLSVVFLTILTAIQSTARTIPWAAYALTKQDETAQKVPNHPFANLLYTPNPNQSWSDFVTAYIGQYLATGNVFIYLLRNDSGSNKGKVQAMYLMPADTVVVKANSWIAAVQGYKVPNGDGSFQEFTPDEVLHLKKYNSENYLYGLSPLQAGALTLTSVDEALKQRIRLLANGGPKTIITDDSKEGGAELTADQENDMLASINRANRANRAAFLPMPLKVQQVGANAIDLEILQSLAFDAGMLADLYAYPSMLLSSSESKTFNNYDAAMKALYTGCVIPLLVELKEALNRKLGPAYKDQVYIDLDTSGIEFLKENQVALVTALGTDCMTKNERRKMLGLPAIDGGDELTQASAVAVEAVPQAA